MALARRPLDPPPSIEAALASLRAAGGGPLPMTVGGEVVAYLVTPEELERLEDERDLAILRAGRAEAEGERRFTLGEVAGELGIELPD